MAYIGTMINDSSTVSMIAAADLNNVLVAVELGTDGVKVATAGSAALGIIMPEDDGVKAGERVNVAVKDIVRWTAGAAVNAGDLLAVGTDGKAVKATEGAFVVGIALETAHEAGIQALVQITKSGFMTAAE